jgi:hypothetical protein
MVYEAGHYSWIRLKSIIILGLGSKLERSVMHISLPFVVPFYCSVYFLTITGTYKRLSNTISPILPV